eukprot:jgi/Hompol1/5902/HPOL_000338-RA
MSQTWSRGGLLNPGQKIVSWTDLLNGDLKDEITQIFGEEHYNNVLSTVQQQISAHDDDAKPASDVDNQS